MLFLQIVNVCKSAKKNSRLSNMYVHFSFQQQCQEFLIHLIYLKIKEGITDSRYQERQIGFSVRAKITLNKKEFQCGQLDRSNQKMNKAVGT